MDALSARREGGGGGGGDAAAPAAVHPAARYEPCADLWTVTCIFNPAGWQSKLDNYHRFAAPFHASGLPLVTVDCAIGDAGFALPEGPDVIRCRSASALWQKERLLNLAIQRLPPSATKVVWIDCDVLFADPAWARETSARLDHASVLQPYANWHRLPRGHGHYAGEGQSGVSFASRNLVDPGSAWTGRHGLTGFAWAARRSLLDRHGLYDGCAIGGADQAMAHAFNGSLETINVCRIFGLDKPVHDRPIRRLARRVRRAVLPDRPNPFAHHFRAWAARVRADIDGPIGCVPGDLLHLWHGSPRDRRYHERHGAMRDWAFDPARDLHLNEHGAWEWHVARQDMRRWAEAYFRGRHEDG